MEPRLNTDEKVFVEVALPYEWKALESRLKCEDLFEGESYRCEVESGEDGDVIVVEYDGHHGDGQASQLSFTAIGLKVGPI